MRDITPYKKQFERRFALDCIGKADINTCTERACKCKFAAELKAYRYTILPKGFQSYTIFDYSGLTEQDRKDLNAEEIAIRRRIAVRAKRILVKYCWGMSLEELQNIYRKDSKQIDEKSVMDLRHKQGSCVVIHGVKDRHIGRTMLASIIMREAIKRRFRSNSNALQTYDWIEFATLKDDVLQKTDSMAAAEYQSCDWLVIDNIEPQIHATGRAQNYLSSMLDPFFIHRIEKGLPTILVFRFDIKREIMSIQNSFGIGIDRIINDVGTFKISLIEEEEEE